MYLFDEQIKKIKQLSGVVSSSKHHKISPETREIRGNKPMDLRLKRESVGRKFVSLRRKSGQMFLVCPLLIEKHL